jgi:hypothetical protein
VIVNGPDQKDHPLFQKTTVDVVGALTATGLFNHHRDQIEIRDAHAIILCVRIWKKQRPPTLIRGGRC